MAVEIIRELTLAQVQAAIDAGSTSWNNNYAGTRIWVTDKSWDLTCNLDRDAKPTSGVLKITNGDTLPAWLTPETLLIDTGSLTGDLSNDTGTPVEIQSPTGYSPIYIYSSGTYGNDVLIYDMDDTPLFTGVPITTGPLMNSSFFIGSAYYDTHKLKIAQDFSTATYQAIIEYRKKPGF